MIDLLGVQLVAWVGDYVLGKSFGFTSRAVKAQWQLSSKLPIVNRNWAKVRNELAEVGLLYNPEGDDDDGYLDQIDLKIAVLPSLGEAGYVYESIGWMQRLLGFRPGVIYLPRDLPARAYVPGGTLIDVIRHEYAHAWHWLEPEFFEQPWFYKAFGGSYDDGETVPCMAWGEKVVSSRSYHRSLSACRNEREADALFARLFRQEFVSDYASTLICEDFAETFMTYLRCRRGFDRYRSRPGVYRKLKAVEKAVAKAKRELGL